MLHKITFGFAIAAALLLPLNAFAAKGGRGGGRSVGHSAGRSVGHSTGRSVGHVHSTMRRSAVRSARVSSHVTRQVRSGHGHYHYSHGRHFWHGQWYAYGVGSCWAYDPAYDEYYWVCGDEE
jgi:hypothetical protein